MFWRFVKKLTDEWQEPGGHLEGTCRLAYKAFARRIEKLLNYGRSLGMASLSRHRMELMNKMFLC